MPPAGFPARDRLAVALAAALVAVCLAVYWPVTRQGFLHLDDSVYVTQNPRVRDGLTPAGVAWAFSADPAMPIWHPLTWLSHQADVSLFGLRAGGHHAVGAALHAVNAVLLLLVLYALTGAFWRSALVAALFAVHPQRVESVAWASERKDLLAGLFWLLTMGDGGHAPPPVGRLSTVPRTARDFSSVIGGTGSCIPSRCVPNEEFLGGRLFEDYGKPFDPVDNPKIISKFRDITGITERRHVPDDLVASDLAIEAAHNALAGAEIDPETLDYLIVAHNFGDVKAGNRRSDLVPTLAARVKRALGIANPACVAYDLPFGCPGWLQAVIQADYFLRSGDAKRAPP